MEKLRTSAQERIAAFADKRAQDWLASADRASARGDHATAIYFRNCAWEIQNGQNWIADTSDEPTPPASL